MNETFRLNILIFVFPKGKGTHAMKKSTIIQMLNSMNIVSKNPEIELSDMTIPELQTLMIESVQSVNAQLQESEKANAELSRKNQAQKNKANNANRDNVNATRWANLIALESSYACMDVIPAEHDENGDVITPERTINTFSIVTALEAQSCGFSDSQTRQYVGDMRPSYAAGSKAISRGLLCYPLTSRSKNSIMNALEKAWIERDDRVRLNLAKDMIKDSLESDHGLETWIDKKGKEKKDVRFVLFRMDPELLSHFWIPNPDKIIRELLTFGDMDSDSLSRMGSDELIELYIHKADNEGLLSEEIDGKGTHFFDMIHNVDVDMSDLFGSVSAKKEFLRARDRMSFNCHAGSRYSDPCPSPIPAITDM